MQLTLITLGMVALAVAIPAPMPLPTQAADLKQRRQVGGGIGGSVVGGPSGFATGVVGSSTLAGCIGGGIPGGPGETECFPEATAKPKHKVRQVGGGIGGSVAGGPSGFASGVVGSSTLAGCIGGGIPGGPGETVCFPAPTALAVRNPEAEPQVGGYLGGSVGSEASGTISGEIGSTTDGLIGGVFGGSGTTLYYPEVTALAARVAEPQVGGSVGGSVASGPSGFASGVAGSSTLYGCVGGVLPDGLGATLCGRVAEPTAA